MKKLIILYFIYLISFDSYAQNTYVFFGSYNHDKSKEGIYVYQLDTTNGKLAKITSIKGILNPSFLSLSPGGKYLYACTESKTTNAGSVSSFEFSPENKTLTFINSQKSGGENPVYLTVHKNEKWLINGNYTESSVSVYPLSKKGVIEAAAQNFRFTEGSVHPQRQERSHVHSAVFSPDFDYLFLPDLGSDKIRTYQFNSENSQPMKIAKTPFTSIVPGSGPRHFVFHPNGKFAYCIEELTGTISSYKYEKGLLDSIQRINTHSKKHTENFESSDIHISPDGRFLYASNRGSENNIAIYSIKTDGRLEPVGHEPTRGKHPRVFGIDETGKFLIVTNAVSGDAFVFKRNKETGLLKKVGKGVKIPGVSSAQIRQY